MTDTAETSLSLPQSPSSSTPQVEDNEDNCHSIFKLTYLLERIFTNLSNNDILKCRRVNQLWNDTAILNTIMGKRILIKFNDKYGGKELSDQGIMALLTIVRRSEYTFCRQFEFTEDFGGSGLSPETAELFVELCGQQTTHLKLWGLHNKCMEILLKCPNLESIHVRESYLSEAYVKTPMLHLKTLQITSVNSSEPKGGANMLGPEYFPKLSNIILHLRGMEYFLKNCFSLNNGSLVTQIRSLDIDHYKYSDINLTLLKVFVPGFLPDILQLKIFDIPRAIVENLVKSFSKNLTVLELAEIRDPVSINLFANIPNLRQLKLYLQGITPEPLGSKWDSKDVFIVILLDCHCGAEYRTIASCRSLLTMRGRLNLQVRVAVVVAKVFMIFSYPKKLHLNLTVIGNELFRTVCKKLKHLEELKITTRSILVTLLPLTGIKLNEHLHMTEFVVFDETRFRRYKSILDLPCLSSLTVECDFLTSPETILMFPEMNIRKIINFDKAILYGVRHLKKLSKLVLHGVEFSNMALSALTVKKNLQILGKFEILETPPQIQKYNTFEEMLKFKEEIIQPQLRQQILLKLVSKYLSIEDLSILMGVSRSWRFPAQQEKYKKILQIKNKFCLDKDLPPHSGIKCSAIQKVLFIKTLQCTIPRNDLDMGTLQLIFKTCVNLETLFMSMNDHEEIPLDDENCISISDMELTPRNSMKTLSLHSHCLECEMYPNFILSVIKACPNLENFASYAVDPKLLMLFLIPIVTKPSLTTIYLDGRHPHGITKSHLRLISQECKGSGLKQLYLKNTNADSAELREVFKANSNLEAFHLENVSNLLESSFTDVILPKLKAINLGISGLETLSFLSSIPSVESLTLLPGSFRTLDLLKISVSQGCKSNSVKALKLHNSSLPSDNQPVWVENLSFILSIFPSLISVSTYSIPEVPLYSLQQFVKTLQEIVLIDCHLSDMEFTGLPEGTCYGAKPYRQISKQDLHCRRITGYIGDFKNLRKLVVQAKDMYTNKNPAVLFQVGKYNLTDVSVFYGILDLPNLKVLKMAGLKITDKAVCAIGNRLSLQEFRIENCLGVSRAARRAAPFLQCDGPIFEKDYFMNKNVKEGPEIFEMIQTHSKMTDSSNDLSIL